MAQIQWVVMESSKLGCFPIGSQKILQGRQCSSILIRYSFNRQNFLWIKSKLTSNAQWANWTTSAFLIFSWSAKTTRERMRSIVLLMPGFARSLSLEVDSSEPPPGLFVCLTATTIVLEYWRFTLTAAGSSGSQLQFLFMNLFLI